MSLDPQSQAVLNAINATGVLPLSQFDPVEARARLLSLRAAANEPPKYAIASVTEETIATDDGAFRVRVLRPRGTGSGEKLPVLLYFHGGGFFAGGLDETDHIVRQIANQADVVVVNVDYHLSPEAKFPVAVNDCYAALRWVVDNAQRLAIDPDRIVIAGDSAGGNLTIVTCLMARERGGPAIRLQVPIYPSLNLRARPDYKSRHDWGGGEYFLVGDDIEWMLDHYLNDRSEGDDWRVSPVAADDYRGLPPALVITASHDPLVDEGAEYAERLARDGVPVEYARFEGTIHGFVSFSAVVDSGARAMDLICNRIADAVGRETAEPVSGR